MALFGFGKKNEENKNTSCCCASAPEAKAEPACACNGDAPASAAAACCCGGEKCAIQSIKVLGSGCKRCHDLNETAHAAVKELGMKIDVEYITDMEKIVNYGVMSLPALVVNEKVVSAGKVLKPAEIIKLFTTLGYCEA